MAKKFYANCFDFHEQQVVTQEIRDKTKQKKYLKGLKRIILDSGAEKEKKNVEN
jgi:hypothetical protein